MVLYLSGCLGEGDAKGALQAGKVSNRELSLCDSQLCRLLDFSVNALAIALPIFVYHFPPSPKPFIAMLASLTWRRTCLDI